MNKRRLIRVLMFSITGIFMMVWLLRNGNIGEMFRILREGDRHFWMAALLVGVCAHICNGFRITVCLGRSLPLSLSVCISAVHNFMLMFMPLRSGEISFVLLSRRYARGKTGGSIASLGIMRFSDLTVFLVLCIYSAVVVGSTVRVLFVPLLFLTLFVVVLLTAGIMMTMHGSPVLRKLHAWIRIPFVRRGIMMIIDVFSEMTTVDGRLKLQRVLPLSFVYWFFVFLQAYLFFLSFSRIRPDYYLVLFSMVNLIALLPVHGFLHIGTNEVVNVSILGSMGFDLSAATAIALGGHILIILSAVLFGGTGIVFLKSVVNGLVVRAQTKEEKNPGSSNNDLSAGNEDG